MTNNTPAPADLLPCPFCRGEADGPNYDDEYDLHLIRCKDSADCGSGIWQHSETEAIAAWNRRAATITTQPDPRDAEIERLREALQKIERRTDHHPDDEAGDDKRDKHLANQIARAALAKSEGQ